MVQGGRNEKSLDSGEFVLTMHEPLLRHIPALTRRHHVPDVSRLLRFYFNTKRVCYLGQQYGRVRSGSRSCKSARDVDHLICRFGPEKDGVELHCMKAPRDIRLRRAARAPRAGAHASPPCTRISGALRVDRNSQRPCLEEQGGF